MSDGRNMKHASYWSQQDALVGNCLSSMVGMAKPKQLLDLLDENDRLKEQVAQATKTAGRNAATIAAQEAERGTLQKQIADLGKQMSAFTVRVQPQQPSTWKPLDDKLLAQMESMKAERAELDRVKASLAEQSAALEKDRKELCALRDELMRQSDELRERESAIASKTALGERKQAILNGDMTSITESMVADIARLEEDVAMAHQRMLAVDRMQYGDKNGDRQHWNTICMAATRELRAVRQQLIQLPRPTDADPKRWKDNLVATIALAMDRANVPSRTIIEFVSKSAAMLASQDVRRIIARKAEQALAVPR